MTDKPRLIEVAFPLEQASLTSVHEKNVRHGHISTLHIWPARRPLAASRAALLCTLLPDPGDAQKRQELLDLIGGTVVKKLVTSEDDEGNSVSEEKDVVKGGVLAWGNENEPAMDTLRAAIKKFCGGNAPKVLDPFAGGGAIPLEAMRLGCEVTSADLNPVAWFIQKCTLEYPQQFAGKKWPLPDFVHDWPDFVEDYIVGKIKKRRGDKKPHFTDAVNRELHEAATDAQAPSEKASADFKKVALPDADLAWHVRAWGRWVLERARQDLGKRYSIMDGEPTVAYLWARTARDPQTAGRIPLLKSFLLSKSKGKRVALLPVPANDGSSVSFKLLREADLAQPQQIVSENEFLQRWGVSAETLEVFLKNGTMNRAGVWSLCSGRPGVISLTIDDLRRQGQQGLLGTQMTAVVVERKEGNKTRKYYRLPKANDHGGVEIEDITELFSTIPFGLPCEQIFEDGKRSTWCVTFGFDSWDKMFLPRQKYALGIFVKHTREAIQQVIQKEKDGLAIAGLLYAVFAKLLNYMSTTCMWDSKAGEVKQTFSRYAFPVMWDFAEANPLSDADRYYMGGMNVVASVTSHLLQAQATASKPSVMIKSVLESNEVGLDYVITDPPYYDAISYSILSDFFYVWLRRLMFGFDATIDKAFENELTPKWNEKKHDGELVDDSKRFGGDRALSKKNYEDGMSRAFAAILSNLKDDGRIIVVFANKKVDAWEALIGGLIRGGATVVASWPIKTEMPGGFRNFNRASLSSSVWIVCRKRAASAAPGWEEPVLERMKQILFDRRDELGGKNILQYFFDLGISGPDFIWAALGPSLQAYSEHPFVKKTGGGVMTVREFLDEVRKLVLQFSLGELPGFRELQRETQGRGESVALDPVTQYYLLHRAYFGLTAVPAGACILYANACGKDETELKVVWNILEQGGQSGPGKKGRPRKDAEEGDDVEEAEESKGNEYRLLDWSERIESDNLGESRGGLPSPLIDKLHRLMALFQRNQAGEVQSLYES
ncbi:MAG TPA: DUF1156 domain-containing protein, partial [Sedimentisphaerales bacterium]